MAQTDTLRAKCFDCGFEAPAGGEAWATVDHPPLGTIMQCPECGSTDIHSRA